MNRPHSVFSHEIGQPEETVQMYPNSASFAGMCTAQRCGSFGFDSKTRRCAPECPNFVVHVYPGYWGVLKCAHIAICAEMSLHTKRCMCAYCAHMCSCVHIRKPVCGFLHIMIFAALWISRDSERSSRNSSIFMDSQ
eukprot:3928012-Rhodomonas_salina.1